jgi:hypothetical protein
MSGSEHLGEEDKAVRLAAAQTEEAWEGAGTETGGPCCHYARPRSVWIGTPMDDSRLSIESSSATLV